MLLASMQVDRLTATRASYSTVHFTLRHESDTPKAEPCPDPAALSSDRSHQRFRPLPAVKLLEFC
jgi:hypothetical protein